MKVPIKWLQEYVDITLSTAEIADRLTFAGSEVEGMQVIGGNWENIVVGQVIAINPHPNAERLTLPTINLGTVQQTVVCGAPNLRPGDKIAFAHIGAQLIDGLTGQASHLKSAKIRGVLSEGMVCSEKELGISDNHEGIMILPPEAPVGTTLTEYLGDVIFDLSITPNRPDCLSVIGIAREVAALTGRYVHLPEVSYKEAAYLIEQQISVEIVATDLCPRYCASMIAGIKVAESPPWMQQRLLACGLRPINNIVDITNYVMLEHGQPLHAFDYHRIRGKRIIVRRAKVGETILTLDGTERVLSEEMLVIADEDRSVAIAGIMGSANSEITPDTTSVLLEAANFNPTSIYYTGSSLRLPSDACMRFERGIRPELSLPALKRATQLIQQIAGGEVAKGWVDVYPGRREHEPILVSMAEVKRLVGVEFSLDQIVEALTSLDFDCKPEASAVWATAPYWRSDINLAVDLIEEVVRVLGYDTIPTTMLSQPLPRQTPAPILQLKEQVRRSLTDYGFQELVTFSLTSLERLQWLHSKPHPVKPMPLSIANPMTAGQEYLRPNLRANVLATLEVNRRHEDSSIRFFELGKVYLPRPGDLPDEREIVCGILSRARIEKLLLGPTEPLDFYDAKGVVESLLNQLGVEASFVESEDESLLPGRQAAIVIENNRLGILGELHPKVLEAFNLSETVYLFEIYLTNLLPFTVNHKMFQPIPRFPAVVRDIALIVDTTLTHQKIQEVIKSFSLVTQVSIFDIYTGGQVPPGKKSLAYRISFQSTTHTLTDEEVNMIQQQILDKLSRKFGAILRA
jgi:phenylalanyl-tRNA synthetase beta chain